MESWPVLSLITFSPLLGVLVLLFMKKEAGKWIKRIGIVATVIPLVLAAALYVQFDRNQDGMQFAEKADWFTIELNKDSILGQDSFYYAFQYNLAVDGLSLPLVFLTALVFLMAALASVHIKKRWKTYYILFLLLETGVFGVFLAKDLFLFFLFFELTLIPAYFLISIWGLGNREKAANKFIIYNGIGSAMMLIAFLIIINTGGFHYYLSEEGTEPPQMFYSGDLENIAANMDNPSAYPNLRPSEVRGEQPFYMSDGLKTAIFVLLLIAFGIKIPIFPFHTWMLKVHKEAPPGLVMIHSGLLLKMGAYGLIRFGVYLFPEQAQSWALVLGILGVINILYGAVIAIVQREFRLILAYSSVSHMGIVLLGIAALNHIGLSGAVFQMVSHGLISALLFLIVGSLHERTGTTRIDRLGGLAKPIPFISGMLLAAGFASLGLPGLSGFVSEYLAFLGLYDVMPAVTILGVLGIIFAAAYVLRGIMRMTFGTAAESLPEMRDARLVEAVPMISLFAFILLLGVYPSVLSRPLQFAIENLVLRIGG